MNEPKQVVRRYLDALVAGDLDVIRDSFAADAVWTIYGDLPIAGPWHGRDAIVDDFLTTVGGELYEPGSVEFEFPTLLADGDTVTLEWRVRARTARGGDYANAYCGLFVDPRRQQYDESRATRCITMSRPSVWLGWGGA